MNYELLIMNLKGEIQRLADEIERMKKYYDDLLLHLDSDNIIEIDFGRTRIRQGESDSTKMATREWVLNNFQGKEGEPD